MLDKEMVQNVDKDVSDSHDTRKTSVEVDHEHLKIEKGKGKWNGSYFPDTKQVYQKYSYCMRQFGCKNKVRTYCKCNMDIYCNTCWAIHYVDCVNVKDDGTGV